VNPQRAQDGPFGPQPDPRVRAIVDYFQTLAPAGLGRLGSIYRDDASFKDPFNEVRGLPAIRRIYGHMFEQVDEPRFLIRSVLARGDDVFLTWDFRFRMKRFQAKITQNIHGATHLRLAPDGRIAMHRDYWDAAGELYEKLPLVGPLMRWLKARAGK
jgi:hypothetical protein